jgi:hypothetical protein
MQGLAVANDIPPCIYHTPHGPNIGSIVIIYPEMLKDQEIFR